MLCTAFFHKYAVGDVDLIDSTVILDSLVSINKISLVLHQLPEILRKRLFAFWLNHSHDLSQHQLLFFLSFRAKLVCGCYLQDWLFMAGMILGKVVTEPDF